MYIHIGPGTRQTQMVVFNCSLGSLLFLFLRDHEGEQWREAGVNEKTGFCLNLKNSNRLGK